MHVAPSTDGGLLAPLRRYLEIARDQERVLIGDAGPDVGKVFMACMGCGKIRPMYQLAEKKVACKCGSIRLRPTRIPEWQAAWWVLVVGGLWRRLILRKKETRFWEPRMPMRFRDPAY